MFQPVGPLPASVYWRRRAAALAAVLLVILLLWAVWPGGGDGGERRTAAATTATPSPDPGELTATPPPDDPGRAADPGAGASSAGTGTGAGTTGTAPAATTPAPAPPPRAAPPKPCPDTALQLRVRPGQPAYRVGTQPKVTLVVRNVSTVACTRDLGVAEQEVLLYRGTQRLWSSNDCYSETTRAVRTLRPGESVSSSVTWSGLSSRQRCAGTRTRVAAGTYELVGRIGTLLSPRARIALV